MQSTKLEDLFCQPLHGFHIFGPHVGAETDCVGTKKLSYQFRLDGLAEIQTNEILTRREVTVWKNFACQSNFARVALASYLSSRSHSQFRGALHLQNVPLFPSTGKLTRPRCTNSSYRVYSKLSSLHSLSGSCYPTTSPYYSHFNSLSATPKLARFSSSAAAVSPFGDSFDAVFPFESPQKSSPPLLSRFDWHQRASSRVPQNEQSKRQKFRRIDPPPVILRPEEPYYDALKRYEERCVSVMIHRPLCLMGFDAASYLLLKRNSNRRKWC